MQTIEFVIALFVALCPGADRAVDPAIIDAIASVRADDAERALMVVYAWRESDGRQRPRPVSPGAIDGTTCGFLQEPCGFVERASLSQQADYWLGLLRNGESLCPEHPSAPLAGGCKNAASVAKRREAEADRILCEVVPCLYAEEP